MIRSGYVHAAVLGGILAAAFANVGHTSEWLHPSLSQARQAHPLTISDASRCAANPIAEITVATLNNAPIVTVLANGKPVILLLDTGAESTIFLPAAAERIGAT